MSQFLETDVLGPADDFFSEVGEPTGAETSAWPLSQRVSSVPGKLILGAMAIVALSLLPMDASAATVSRPYIHFEDYRDSGAAVEVPSLSKEQVRGARFIQAGFRAIPVDRDEDGDDPDYGF